MNHVDLLWHEFRFGLLGVRRSPFALMLGFLFPFAFLLIFNVVGDASGRPALELDRSEFTVAAVSVFAIATSAYFNMSLGVVNAREKGLLRRVRAMSAAPGTHLVARGLVVAAVTSVSLALMTFLSIVVFGLPVDALLPARLLLLVVIATFAAAALGVAVSSLAAGIEAGMVIYSASLFPVLFLSGVFFPLGDGFPAVLDTVVKLLPFYWMAELARWTFQPAYIGSGWQLAVVVLVGWGLAASLVARWTVGWLPRSGR
ncbi:MAG: ABC transporter permease [Acidimicrobiales bacterium]